MGGHLHAPLYIELHYIVFIQTLRTMHKRTLSRTRQVVRSQVLPFLVLAEAGPVVQHHLTVVLSSTNLISNSQPPLAD